ncbi:hypothetical protein [Piscirickettsia salmonis]|uniref:hypothetical protein n=1 Tax=Piscirickettsia salmonis TaxID=1238 RepID=UPI000563ED7F|nr:hypothetical protein [Piscirickettsia salmonis]QHS31590.1 hypothetical protein GW535_02695 [Piscirickettsia salmonis]QIX56493.1 hypothetical protein GW536_14895 [Piscirickettsia salmonis]
MIVLIKSIRNWLILTAPSLLICTSCALKQPSQTPSVTYQHIEKFSKILATDFQSAIDFKSPSLNVAVSLLLAPTLDIKQFRNARSISNPNGLNAASHDFFITFDGLFPLAGNRSLFRTYKAIVAAAKCVHGKENYPGCIFLRQTVKYLSETPKRNPSLFRQGWPDWLPIDANPIHWADNSTQWIPLTITIGKASLTTKYLYVNLIRPWFSEEFITSHDWYIPGHCRGFISSGRLNEGTIPSHELLPIVPTGLIITKDLLIKENGITKFSLISTHLSGWVYKKLPTIPQDAEPNYKHCTINNTN